MTLSPGERIKELRLLAEMSQDELGKRVGVQRAAINKYEKGTVENIPIKTIERMAQVFDVSPSYIVGWNNQEANLSAEVKTLQGVKLFYGKESVELLESFHSLTPNGKKKVLQYLDDIYWAYKSGDIN
jgi:transcriptional regulator with XRE-family HTH domain